VQVVHGLDQAGRIVERVAILRELAQRENVALPADAALYIAQNVASNTAALNGAMVRLAAFSSLTGTPITLAVTQRVLKNFIHPQSRKFSPVTLQTILERQRGAKGPTAWLGPCAEFSADFPVLKMQEEINRRVRSVLEVNTREREREQLARRDVYEKELRVRAWKRKQA